MTSTLKSSSPTVTLSDVMSAYVGNEHLPNAELYKQVALDLGLPPIYAEAKSEVGSNCAKHNLFHRKVRWHQQTLRSMGILERMDRGNWKLSPKAKKEIVTEAPKGQTLIAFSTDLGCALWGRAEDVFGNLPTEETISLIFTSPPYCLSRERAYGNVDQKRYVTWLCEMLEPIVKKLRDGGNLALNLSQDIFEPGLPSRSLYLERLTLALSDMGLHLMDRFVWQNPTKAPGPVQWASLKRVQCNVGYEVVLWFTNNPETVIADNRRVLLPHTEKHKELMARGGESRQAKYSGGAYSIRKGSSFANVTDGRIPRNVLNIPHRDNDQKPAREFALQNGIPQHPAPMPLKLASFFVNFLSEVGDLIADPYGGIATTAKAAEIHGRRWITTEMCRQYIASAAERFRSSPGFSAC